MGAHKKYKANVKPKNRLHTGNQLHCRQEPHSCAYHTKRWCAEGLHPCVLGSYIPHMCHYSRKEAEYGLKSSVQPFEEQILPAAYDDEYKRKRSKTIQ